MSPFGGTSYKAELRDGFIIEDPDAYLLTIGMHATGKSSFKQKYSLNHIRAFGWQYRKDLLDSVFGDFEDEELP